MPQCVNCDHHLSKDDYENFSCQTCGHPVSYYDETDENEEDEFVLCPFCENIDCNCDFGVVIVETD